MRDLHLLDAYRNTDPVVAKLYGGFGDAGTGVFGVPSEVDGLPLQIIASDLLGWDHVSVSRIDRCPTWAEMEQVKRLFFRDDETAMQLHVPTDQHINVHRFCLHLWRPQDRDIPRPPAVMVGPANRPGRSR
jgi:hypothetical protein